MKTIDIACVSKRAVAVAVLPLRPTCADDCETASERRARLGPRPLSGECRLPVAVDRVHCACRLLRQHQSMNFTNLELNHELYCAQKLQYRRFQTISNSYHFLPNMQQLSYCQIAISTDNCWVHKHVTMLCRYVQIIHQATLDSRRAFYYCLQSDICSAIR